MISLSNLSSNREMSWRGRSFHVAESDQQSKVSPATSRIHSYTHRKDQEPVQAPHPDGPLRCGEFNTTSHHYSFG